MTAERGSLPLQGKIVLVTGGGSGIGRSIATRLARDGAALAVADVVESSALECAGEIEAAGGRAIAMHVDVTSKESVFAMVAATVEAFGRIDIAVNNAGVGHNSAFLEIAEEDWDRMFAVNAKGVFLSMQAEGLQMKNQGSGGKIINIASIAGRHGPAYQAHYGASKAAVINLTQSTAKALAPYGITVNAINPGIVDTPMWRRTDGEIRDIRNREGENLESGDVTEEMRSQIPLGRISRPDDVASLAFYLASSDSDYVTGQAFNVCGGLIMD
ncbi:MAG: glucose 1-dehydrogenase [Thermomicrobiales bacterium]|nr:glucose 1-dehydrogenase [Thermomicrobiales bacterium]